jgi:hypothetical protein
MVVVMLILRRSGMRAAVVVMVSSHGVILGLEAGENGDFLVDGFH